MQYAQSIHGVIEFNLNYPSIIQEWHDTSNRVVILAVQNEAELKAIIEKATMNHITMMWFSEPDLNNQITSVVLEPTVTSAKLVANIKLAT